MSEQLKAGSSTGKIIGAPKFGMGSGETGERGLSLGAGFPGQTTMAIKTYRPITPTLRFKTTQVNDDLTMAKPHKPLLAVKQRTGGRRNQGDLTIRHQGGGHKQMLRLIDFKREKYGIPGKVATRSEERRAGKECRSR